MEEFRRALRRSDRAHYQALLVQCAHIERIGKGREAGDPWQKWSAYWWRWLRDTRRAPCCAALDRGFGVRTGCAPPLVVLGGTFDPVHRTHIALAVSARDALGRKSD